MTPMEVAYEGEALAVSSSNSEGKFDIIPQHANFVTIVENQPITVLKTDKSKLNFNFSQAIIYCSANQVKVYADPKTISLK